MYLKRAPASSGCAVLQFDMFLGPRAAGGSPKHSFLLIFSLQKQRDSQQHNIIIRNDCVIVIKNFLNPEGHQKLRPFY